MTVTQTEKCLYGPTTCPTLFVTEPHAREVIPWVYWVWDGPYLVTMLDPLHISCSGYLIGRCSRDPEPMKISDLIRTQGWEADGFSNVPLSPTTTTVATSLSEHSASVCTLGASHLLAGEVCRGWDWLMVWSEMFPKVAERHNLRGVFNREPWEGSPRPPTPHIRSDLNWGCHRYRYSVYPDRAGCNGVESMVSGT